jgi:hypothetical protein
MLYINILTKDPKINNFLHQLDEGRFNKIARFFENSEDDYIWDMVIVYEGIVSKKKIKVKKGGLIFISGEPPMSSVYPKKYLLQFDMILSSHKKIKHNKSIISQQALNWHFGYDFVNKIYKYNYEDLKNLPIPKKGKGISIITSSKKMMPGHNKRMKLVKVLRQNFGNYIDFYGKDTNPIDDKALAILPYKFHICIENSFIDDYWTEKLADPILGYSIPIYIGCTNIKKYFHEDFSYQFKITEVVEICELIENICKNPDLYYYSKIEGLITARNKILDYYNIFPTIINLHKKITINDSNYQCKILKPSHNFNSYNYLLYTLRAKRFLNRIYLNKLYY